MAESNPKIADTEVNDLYTRIETDAKSGGYNLNPDQSFTRELIRGLAINTKRYGYMACPCRLAAGKREEDLDIICPCDYRDPDLAEYGACFCALYVSDAIAAGEKKAKPIPERRGKEKGKVQPGSLNGGLSMPVWRCSVCGYLCAREDPPEKCPVCKVSKDRFQLFIEAS
ncbi:MAG: ferredoxin-thioredoxin reductase catalytic domain-containing protein [Spirochaetota bacterium]